MKKERIFYARKCEYTGKGMSQGYLFCDDSCMTDDRDLLIKELRKDREAIMERLPDDIEDIKTFDNQTNDTPRELIKLINSIKKAKANKETDEELCDISYAVDYYHYTDWECSYDIEWEEVNGKLISIEEYSDEEEDKIKNGEYDVILGSDKFKII
tara:strand:- start:173 stop:640 length:468 start_codon:yes stop_codon:yes gene_type:complete